ncbi:hypothetical protein CAPTEDRAFT_188115 [Capitella teleta]|uniref:Uncharacterized protein n=1 Tax=Capitella teleta TaxID=283909 RepID=R7V0J7_CAPTE|nr:hypothetical protein CAPTEDRAFT_188115 [Capitella teleta]|eukprot:ELU12032.1 hypothetical protein CAPTEDRAFT_188115 [Capitella teleta]
MNSARILRGVASAALRRRNVEMVIIAVLVVSIGSSLLARVLPSKEQWVSRKNLEPKELRPSLTLCTTFSDNPARFEVHSQTVYNWASLRPRLRPVLFAANLSSDLSLLAKSHGWEVQRVTKADKQGMPYINEMFKHIQAHYRSHFYGYANGDMLFSRSLTDTTESLPALLEGKSEQYVFVGQRRSINYVDMLKQDKEFWQPDHVHKYSCTKGHTDPPTSIDFFITTPFGFPWDTLPKLVVGKTRFDNYIIMMAMYLFMGTVDVTGTVHNLHMTGGGHMTHKDSGLADQSANERVINSFGRVAYELGSVANCKYFTRNTRNGMQMARLLQWQIPASFRGLQSERKETTKRNKKRKQGKKQGQEKGKQTGKEKEIEKEKGKEKGNRKQEKKQ